MDCRARSSPAKASATTGAPSARSCSGPRLGSTRRCAGSGGSKSRLVAGALRLRARVGLVDRLSAVFTRLQRRALDPDGRLRLVRGLHVEHLFDRTRPSDAIALRIADALLPQELERLIV